MTQIYVAKSAGLSKWASDVGLGKFVFKVGAADDAEAAVKALNEEGAGGAADWALVKAEAAEGLDDAAVAAKLARKEKPVDPTYYPRLKGLSGLFKVKIENVENHLTVKQLMENRDAKPTKPKLADIAQYLIANALK